MPLEVGIVGAGIAGLASAIALRRTGANVEVSHSFLSMEDFANALLSSSINPTSGLKQVPPLRSHQMAPVS